MRWMLALVLGMLALVGCNRGPKLVPVTGRVVVEGREHLGETTVALVPLGKLGTERIQGMVHPKGDFQLHTYPHGNGVIPGRYKVLVMYESGGKAFEHYGFADATPLEIDVPVSGLTDYEIKLTPKK